MSTETVLQPIDAESSPEVQMNENIRALSAAAIFAMDATTTVLSGLTWGFLGGLYNGNTKSPGTLSLTNGADNYVVVLRSTGVVSSSTSSTNSLDPLYAKLYLVTTAGGVVTNIVDQRMDANGLLFGGAGTIGSRIGLTFEKEFALSDLVTDLTTGTSNGYWRPTFDADSVSYRLSLLDASSSGSVTVDMNKNASTMTSTPASIQVSEFDSATGVSPTMTDPDFVDGDVITWDIDAAGTDAKGLIVTVTGVYQS